MRRLLLAFLVIVATSASFAQDRVDIGPVELIMPGAPDPTQATSHAPATANWANTLTPAIKLGLIMAAIGVPMALVIAGRLWCRLPEGERALVLLSVAMGRGRGFRARVRSLSASSQTARGRISPVAMLLAPRAFDAALNSATHAERAYGQPLRHAVHGFRKS